MSYRAEVVKAAVATFSPQSKITYEGTEGTPNISFTGIKADVETSTGMR